LSGLNVAVVGATGAVGQEFLKVLERRNFPVNRLRPLASERSAGKSVIFKNEPIPVEVLSEDSFKNIDLALFSAGGDVSRNFAPIAVKSGAIVVDNSSAFRMDENVPLIVPEVNSSVAKNHKGIIANPNCSTIQMVVALKPIYDISRITRIIVSTYQSVSGTGQSAMNELKNQVSAFVNGGESKPEVYPYPIAFNLIPQIDAFEETGFTKEEMKMVNETHKILDDYNISIAATAVRVPVFRAHSESVYIETEKKVVLRDVKEALASAKGIIVQDNPRSGLYPTPLEASGSDMCFVGRIREDLFVANGLHLWVVADNLLKGAALNAVQIAEIIF
jgi:aspartate-semialdehyde dehydrogenase